MLRGTMEEALCLLCLSSLLMFASQQQQPGDKELLPLLPASTYWDTSPSHQLITVRPSSSQFFSGDSVTLSCDLHPSNIRRTTRKRESQCGQGWGEPGNSSCYIDVLMIWDSGVFWCESRDGETSERINITITDSSVLLQSPVLPVMEGQDVSLSCRSKNAPSNHTASFYRGAALIGTSHSGHMTLPGVSRSDEDFYSCSISGAQSESSWISITASTLTPPTAQAPPTVLMSPVRVLCHLVVFCPYCICTLITMSVCRRTGTSRSVSMAMNPSVNADQRLDDDYDVTSEVITVHQL
ncbi:Fc receptor-like protein 5 [Gouania willdenowi]|uniref:Fc receptor-like protein 5 n=1 Tax=Gouania willdenowi TaxID=441366 RepID=UPI00105552B2|nr:Fc receptor-like protein 5 [Gouania willdenowi]XP_028329808.1 Fc receptor-like protein 5 [Gouania willdenowi]